MGQIAPLKKQDVPGGKNQDGQQFERGESQVPAIERNRPA